MSLDKIKSMFTCNTHITQTLEVKQSKFIAHIMPYDQLDSILEQLKQEHPKARHFVNAFRYLNEYDQIVEGCSDDGEPKGTSGKPSLHVLQGNELINTAVIIVRYFGGTKLGTGGLVRAYSEAVNLCVEATDLQLYEKLMLLRFSCAYHDLGRVEYVLDQVGVKTLGKEFATADVSCVIKGTTEQLQRLKEELNRMIKLI